MFTDGMEASYVQCRDMLFGLIFEFCYILQKYECLLIKKLFKMYLFLILFIELIILPLYF